MKGKIVLFGCGGHARSVVNTIHKTDKAVEILLVDKNAREKEEILGCATSVSYQLCEEDNYLIAIGDNQERKSEYERLLLEKKGTCISVISESANIGIEAKIGNGSFIAEDTYIGPQAIIGNNTIINTSCVVEHEVIIGNNTHIAPNTTICGRTVIGNEVFCGAGSVIIDNMHICDNVIIGAGTVVREDITESGVYAGVPAEKIKELEKC